MNGRLKVLGVALAVLGLAFIAGGGFAYYKTNQGAQALQAFSAAQNVTLSYNDQGQLVDRGETAGADKIMSLLVNDWGFTVDKSELNPNDPLVNTASEYMFQMATISYHTLHGATTVTFPEDVVVDGQVVQAAGTYDFQNDGRYWTGFDRTNPIEGAAREKLWTGTAHALIAELGVGSVTASALRWASGWRRSSPASAARSSSPASAWSGRRALRPRRARSRSSARRARSPSGHHPGHRPGTQTSKDEGSRSPRPSSCLGSGGSAQLASSKASTNWDWYRSK